MKIIEVKNRTPDLINQLLEVWEGSVRATHLFLSDDEIKSIKEYVPQALNGIAHLMIAEDESGRAVAFMGIEDGSLEMLFLSLRKLRLIQCHQKVSAHIPFDKVKHILVHLFDLFHGASRPAHIPIILLICPVQNRI